MPEKHVATLAAAFGLSCQFDRTTWPLVEGICGADRPSTALLPGMKCSGASGPGRAALHRVSSARSAAPGG